MYLKMQVKMFRYTYLLNHNLLFNEKMFYTSYSNSFLYHLTLQLDSQRILKVVKKCSHLKKITCAAVTCKLVLLEVVYQHKKYLFICQYHLLMPLSILILKRWYFSLNRGTLKLNCLFKNISI